MIFSDIEINIPKMFSHNGFNIFHKFCRIIDSSNYVTVYSD